MNHKFSLRLALVFSCALASLSTSADETNSLRIVVKPSKTEVRVKEVFKVALRVENPTNVNQTVRVMNCSWDEEWKSSNTNISWIGWSCTKNFAVSVVIPPGGAYTNELQMLIPQPISAKTLSFRMGFTPIDSPNTFWSDEVIIKVAPQAAENRVIQSGKGASVMTDQINQAASLLAEFEKDKSIDQLESAFRAVERISSPGVDKTVEPTVARRQLAKMWLSLLAAIDRNTDPGFDDPHNPENLVALNLAPPPTPEGIRYPSGVDPKEIKDPKTRAQYEAAIKQNNDRILRANFQTGLRNIDMLAGLDVRRFFPAYYTSSKEDQSELVNLMQQAKLSPVRTLKLKALFESTSLAGNDTNTNLTKQISDILAECQKIKPGMTRAELQEVFAAEGGLSSATHRTFVYRVCPYIKVDVDFTPSDSKQKVVEERPNDTISRISKPYLDWRIND